MKTQRLVVALGIVGFLAATLPLLFNIYRTAAFNAIPTDDYASYLLNLVGDGGSRPGAPVVYRVLAVAAAAPFYYLLPHYRFTNLVNPDPEYLHATFALSFLSYLALLATTAVIYVTCRRRLGASRLPSALTALLSFVLESHVATTGIDAFVILTVAVLTYALARSWVFVSLILVSAAICEKIPILFAVVLVTRLIVSRAAGRPLPFRWQAVGALTSLGLYAAFVAIARIPGNELQFAPSLWVEHVATTIRCSLSLKGLVLNDLPLLLLLILAYLGWTVRGRRPAHASVSTLSAVVGVVFLVFLAAVGNVHYNVGRIAMHTLPLLIPGLALVIGGNSEALEREREEG